MSALRFVALLGTITVAAAAHAEAAAAPSAAAPAAIEEVISPARYARAVAANTQGLRFYRANQLQRAALRFRDATLLDPGYVLAHYNLACMASRLRDVTAVLTELAWLRASSDPLAAAKLDKARSDADLDFASALPTARMLLGLPPIDLIWPRAPIAWLSERHGVWSVELPTADCASRTYSFVFASSGAVSLTVRESCNGGAPRAHTFDGHAVPNGDSVHVTVDDWPLWPEGVRLTFATCPGLVDAPGACFTLANRDGDEIGPFHRGAPGSAAMARRLHASARVTTARPARAVHR
ncbi:MAG TPA: hypothetical protein VHB97_19160 [Polyangia bacterium]|nr:hypothetical protein [Polyangia bacterium]